MCERVHVKDGEDAGRLELGEHIVEDVKRAPAIVGAAAPCAYCIVRVDEGTIERQPHRVEAIGHQEIDIIINGRDRWCDAVALP